MGAASGEEYYLENHICYEQVVPLSIVAEHDRGIF
jgi:hypothetical protein